MANIKVSELNNATSINNNDLLLVVQNNETKKITKGNLLPYYAKLLWEGNFTSGSITVPELDKYTFIVMVANTVPMYGSKSFGIGGYLQYSGTAINLISYRLDYNNANNTLTIDTVNKGCYDSAGQQQAITHIYGLL